jgi:predicted outer membrane repeat protein
VYRGCQFVDNYVYAASGAGLSSLDSSPTVIDCSFTNNEADNPACSGGAIYLEGGTPYIINSVFAGNRASCIGDGFGGAIRIEVSAPTIVNSLFVGNWVDGGASSEGGAVAISGGGTALVNCTFHNNWAEGGNSVGGALRISDASLSTVSNSILFGNTAAQAPDVLAGSSTQVTHTVVGDPVNCVSTCIAEDPSFADAPGGDFTPQNSACIDTADNTRLGADIADLDQNGDTDEQVPLDVNGAIRVQGNGLDMGAVEAR